MSAKTQQLIDMLAPVVESLEFDFWGLEYVSQGKHSVLRVFIDSENGINVDDCATVSRQISSILDVEDPISGEYNLEVSSPGMDRPLFSLEHYERYKGEMVDMKLRVPFEGRRKFKGQIVGIEGDEVVVLADEHEYVFPIDSIDKANIIPTFAGK